MRLDYKEYLVQKIFKVAILLALLSLSLSAKLSISSPLFHNNGYLESLYTCDGKDISMPLEISGVPKNTKSLALLIDDPDAPMGVFTHWILFNLPPNTKWLPQDFDSYRDRFRDAKEGRNDFGKVGYKGPCPPNGTHRYRIRIFALDKILNLPSGIKRNEFLKSIQGHIIDEDMIIVKYSR